MKNLLLAALVLLWATDSSAQLLSRFTWETTSGSNQHYVADFGPNAVYSGSGATRTAAGNGTPNGLAAGSSPSSGWCCPQAWCPLSCTPTGVDLDFRVPEASSGYFDRGSMTWQIDFRRQNSEIAANFFRRGNNFLFGSDCCGIVYIWYQVESASAPGYVNVGTPISAAGGFDAAVSLDGETIGNTGNGNWITHTFTYDSISGIGEVFTSSNATAVWSSASLGQVYPGQGLYWGGAPGSYEIGTRADGMGTEATIFDNAEVSAPVVLPVKLNYFNGYGENNETRFEWETQTEINTDYFQIERFDPITSEWSLVGTVQAAGNASSTRQYSFVDRNPHAGSNVYTLRQFDKSGARRPMGSVEVIFSDFANRVLDLYPNPVSEGQSIFVRFESAQDTELKLDILSLDGQVVKQLSHSAYAGVNTLDIPMENLSAGMYFFRMEKGGKNAIKKFVITK